MTNIDKQLKKGTNSHKFGELFSLFFLIDLRWQSSFSSSEEEDSSLELQSCLLWGTLCVNRLAALLLLLLLYADKNGGGTGALVGILVMT